MFLNIKSRVSLLSFFEERNKEGFVLLLFKKKQTEENSTYPKPLSTYKGDVIDYDGRPSTSKFW
jgi:hypothetical protein